MLTGTCARDRTDGLLAGFWTAPVVAALLLSAAFPPLDQGWLAVPAWALLLISMRLRGGRRAGWQCLLFGLVVFLAGMYWMYRITWPGMIITVAWCAAYEGLFGLALGRFLRRVPPGRRIWWVAVGPLLHVLADCLREVVLTGIPWLVTGYTGWRNGLLLGSADLWGVHGATLAILLLAAGLAEVTARHLRGEGHDRRAWIPSVACWGLLLVWAGVKSPPEERPGPVVALLQGNVPQRNKEMRVEEGLDTEEAARRADREWVESYVNLLEQARRAAADRGTPLDVVVWPETMVPASAFRPFGPDDGNDRTWEWLSRLSGGARTLAGIGCVEGRPGTEIPLDAAQWNTVVLLDRRGRLLGHQDKQHLCPGGEYVPFLDLMPGGEAVEAYFREKAGYLPSLEAGEGPNLLPLLAGEEEPALAGILVCYESIFPDLSREMVAGGADLLVNASNYGWFVGSPEMEQALAMAVFRAAETRRAVVLAGNNGPSVVIGPDGAVRDTARGEAGASTDVRAFLVARVPLASGLSPYVRTGGWTAWLLGTLGFLLGTVLARTGAGDVNCVEA